MIETFSILYIIIVLSILIYSCLVKNNGIMGYLNVFLLGSTIFVGMSGVNSVTSGHFMNYEVATIIKYFLAIIVFITSVFLGYYCNRRFGLWVQRKSTRIPALSPTGAIICILICMGLTLSLFTNINLGAVSNIQRIVGVGAPAYAIVYGFYLAQVKGFRLLGLISIVVSLMLAVILLVEQGGGRRPLFGVLFAVVLSVYWFSSLRRKPFLVVIVIVLSIYPALKVITAYDAVRWIGTDRRASTTQEVSSATQRLKLYINALERTDLVNVWTLSQTGVEYSLLTIQFYSTEKNDLNPRFMHTIYVLLTFPIPRSLWPGKPDHLGKRIPFEAGILPWGTPTTAGPGIAGHIYHDGGLFVGIIYGLIMGLFLRFMDIMLINVRKNPVILCILAAVSMHLVGWTRGDIAPFTVWILYSMILGVALVSLQRWFPMMRIVSRKY